MAQKKTIEIVHIDCGEYYWPPTEIREVVTAYPERKQKLPPVGEGLEPRKVLTDQPFEARS